jgi:hypothetical protein
MSTKDQLLYSALHGTAMRYAAEKRNLAELGQIAYGRDGIKGLREDRSKIYPATAPDPVGQAAATPDEKWQPI